MGCTSMIHDLWWFMMIYDNSWWFMIIHDDVWWFMMNYDDLWWFTCHTWCFLLQIITYRRGSIHYSRRWLIGIQVIIFVWWLTCHWLNRDQNQPSLSHHHKQIWVNCITNLNCWAMNGDDFPIKKQKNMNPGLGRTGSGRDEIDPDRWLLYPFSSCLKYTSSRPWPRLSSTAMTDRLRIGGVKQPKNDGNWYVTNGKTLLIMVNNG